MNGKRVLVIVGLLVVASFWAVLIGGGKEAHAKARLDLAEQEQSAVPEKEAALDQVPWEAAERTAMESRDLEQLSLRVVSAVDLSVIEDAQIEVLGRKSSTTYIKTDDSGRALVTVRSHTHSSRVLIVEAQGFSRRMVHLEPEVKEADIALHPSSSLRIVLKNETGEPLAGVPVMVLPPDVTGKEWGEEWRSFHPSTIGLGPESMRRKLSSEALPNSTNPKRRESLMYSIPEYPGLELRTVGGHKVNEAFRDCIAFEDWIRKSNNAGEVHFSELPAMQNYRWGVLSGSVIEFEPKADLRVGIRGDGHIELLEGLAAEDISGMFSLEQNTETRLQGTLAGRTGFFGFFPKANPVKNSRVVIQLLQEGSNQETEARGYKHNKMERTGWADEQGLFVWDGVLPGEKILRAWWREENNSLYFARLRFSLEAGEHKDLGAIEARNGVTYYVRTKLQDRSGSRLDPETYLHPNEQPELALSVTGWDEPQSRMPVFKQLVTVPLGEEITLNGMPIGRALFSLDFGPDFKGVLDSNDRLVLPPDLDFSFSQGDSVELPITLEKTVPQEIVASLPSGVGKIRGEVLLMSNSDGRVYRRDLRSSRKREGAIQCELNLPEGKYILYAHSHAQETPKETVSLVFYGDVEVRPNVPIHLDFVPGATIEAVLLDASGVPMPEQAVFLTTDRFAKRDRPAWTHRAKTNKKGEVLLRGLIPGKRYISDSGAFLEAPSMGETMRLRITLP